MAQIGSLYRLVATITCFICLGFNVGMCSESDALIKPYVLSSLPFNDDLINSDMLKVVNEITDMEWDSHVINSKLPVMVMFTADWCGMYCQVMSSLVDELDSNFTDRFTFYKLNIDEEAVLSARYHIHTVPTNVVFKGGNEVGRVIGYEPEKVRELMKKYVS